MASSQVAAGVILYGPPASGKDTITRALAELDARYQLFRRLKVGQGRSSGYQMATSEELARRKAEGRILWENSRYGSTYAIDRPDLLAFLQNNTAVLHLGQSQAIDTVITATSAYLWTVVELWCPQDVAARRIAARGTGDDEQRLTVRAETPHLDMADLRIDTSQMSPEHAAAYIDRKVVQPGQRTGRT